MDRILEIESIADFSTKKCNIQTRNVLSVGHTKNPSRMVVAEILLVLSLGVREDLFLQGEEQSSLHFKTYTPTYGDGLEASLVWVTSEWNRHSWVVRTESLRYVSQVLGQVA